MKRLLLLFILFFSLSMPGQVLLQNNSNYTASSFTYAPSAGYNRAVVFFVAVEFNSTTDAISGLSYGGVAGTLISQTSVTGAGRKDQVAAYRFIETQLATRTSNTVTVTFTGTFNGSDGIGVSAYTLIEVNQTTPFEDAQTYANASSNTATTANINADTDDRVIYLCSSSGSTTTWTPGATFTEHNDITVTGSHRYCIGSVLRTNNGVSSPSATNSSTNRLVMIAFEANFQDAPLPVELLEFTAEKKGKNALLKWSTATELNNSHFDLFRSIDANVYEWIGTVQGNGNSQQIKNYTFVDHHPKSGINYYKLEQVDFDMDRKSYPAIALNFDERVVLDVWNDYFSNDQTFYFQFEQEEIQFQIISADSRIVAEGTLYSSKKELKLDYLSPGIYFIRMQSGNEFFTKKVKL